MKLDTIIKFAYLLFTQKKYLISFIFAKIIFKIFFNERNPI